MSESENELFLTQSKFRKECEEDDFNYRFGKPLSEKELAEKFRSGMSKRTLMKNEWTLGILKRWQEERRNRPVAENLSLSKSCLTDNLVDMTAEDINHVLKFFFFEARKQDGGYYPSTTLYGLFAAFASILKLNGSTFKLFEDDEFKDARRGLDAAMKEMSSKGLGSSCRKHTEVISYDEENILWDKGALGDDSPQKLLDTVLYLTGLHFALRGGKEHRSLRMFEHPQITGPFKDGRGRRYLQYVEDVSKMNPGGVKQRRIEGKRVRANENAENPERCYIRIYEKYKSLCPKTLSENGKDAFYLTPLKVPRENMWYHSVPIGHNTLQNTVQRICQMAGVEGRKSNHSLRATAATRLYEQNVDEQIICEQIGHRSEAVRVYKRTSEDQKAVVRSIIAGKRRKVSATVTVGATDVTTTDPIVCGNEGTPTAAETTVTDELAASSESSKNISLTFNFN